MIRTLALSFAVLCHAAATGALAGPDFATPAKVLFSQPSLPSDQPTRAIGSYARGCLAGGKALPLDGPHWQVMRLSRNRNWGTPQLVEYIERFANDAATLDGYEPQRRPEAINAIHAITTRNKKLLEERDPEVRTHNLDEMRRTAADPARSYQYLLDSAMISSLRRSGMIR